MSDGPKKTRSLRESFGVPSGYDDELFGDQDPFLLSALNGSDGLPSLSGSVTLPGNLMDDGDSPGDPFAPPSSYFQPASLDSATPVHGGASSSLGGHQGGGAQFPPWDADPHYAPPSNWPGGGSRSSGEDLLFRLVDMFPPMGGSGEHAFAALPSGSGGFSGSRSSGEDMAPISQSAFSFVPAPNPSSSNSISTLRPTTSSGGGLSDDQPVQQRLSDGYSGEAPSTPAVAFDTELAEKVGLDALILPRIQALFQMSTQLEERIARIASELRQTPVPYPEPASRALFAKQNQIRSAIEWAAQEIQQMHQNFLLQPPHIYSLMTLQGSFYRMMKQTELYQLEVQHYSGPAVPSHTVKSSLHLLSMIIIRQPFPKPLKQGSSSSSSTEDPILVVLLHGANTRVQALGKVQAVVIHEEYQAKSVGFLSQVKIISEDQPFDNDFCAAFPDIRFDKGTRLKVVRLQFNAKIQFSNIDGVQGTVTLESEATNPFIVITNESQWDYSEGLLFSKEAFPVNQIPWIQFANILQMHYLRTTRQDPKHPERPLSISDMKYILRTQFNNKRYISQKDFMEFWEGFGKIMHKIRHQKAFAMLWLRGLIWGFISKSEAEELLQRQPSGTFVTRFSERVPGKLALAYVKEDPRYGTSSISHYLVAPHDKKDMFTLPDFLSENDCYSQTLKVVTTFNPSTSLVSGIIRKEEAFGPFYTKQTLTPSTLEGYENISRKKTQRPI